MATILSKLYPFANFVDYTILLNRLYNAETNSYSELESTSIFTLTSTNKDIIIINIEQYYFILNGKAILTHVRLLWLLPSHGRNPLPSLRKEGAAGLSILGRACQALT